MKKQEREQEIKMKQIQEKYEDKLRDKEEVKRAIRHLSGIIASKELLIVTWKCLVLCAFSPSLKFLLISNNRSHRRTKTWRRSKRTYRDSWKTLKSSSKSWKEQCKKRQTRKSRRWKIIGTRSQRKTSKFTSVAAYGGDGAFDNSSLRWQGICVTYPKSLPVLPKMDKNGGKS